MKDIIIGSIKLLLISIIVSLLAFVLLDLELGSSVYFFIYLLTFLLVPYWLRYNTKIQWGLKLFLIILVGIISIGTIISLYGTSKAFYRYIIIFCILVASGIIFNYIKERTRASN
jgi:hypothetical protein